MNHTDLSLFIKRRRTLCEHIRTNNRTDQGLVLLLADFEKERGRFRQESSFYYLTGITEPAVALVIDLATEHTTLYMPQYGINRSQWMSASLIDVIQKDPTIAGINAIAYKGEKVSGYQLHPFFHQNEYKELTNTLDAGIKNKKRIFTLCPNNAYAYFDQRFVLMRMNAIVDNFASSLIDISSLVANMRRTKSLTEIEYIFAAISITSLAHESAAQAIMHDVKEAEIQGQIEYIMTASGARIAFPSIVGSGKNSTVLHYHESTGILDHNDVVVVDIGAELNYYCADLTRTYPVSGTFSKRQKELYDIVLDTQEYIAQLAQPGYWLNNKNNPEKSLYHLAKSFLKRYGYDEYFVHGLGHFMGLDVHDVGDTSQPLQPGDVFTIEPGIYLSHESIGIRIEDNYWMTEDGLICLSEELPKTTTDIEQMMNGIPRMPENSTTHNVSY